MSTDLEIVDLTEIVGAIEIPCDYSDELPCPDLPANWIMHRKPCCALTRFPSLACDVCKDHRLLDSFSLECQGCGHIYEHAPEAYSYIEPLNKRGSK